MSLIKAIRQQLGLSVTPANNFTLDASANNGTMKLARGNAGATTQDVMTVDAAGKVAFPQNAQTWQTVSRTSGQIYTNDTGQTIFLSAVISANATVGISSAISVGGVNIATIAYAPQASQGQIATMLVPIPAGANYIWTFTVGTSAALHELRN